MTPQTASPEAPGPQAAAFRFFLTSFFLHPLNNPVWPLIGIVTVYFIFEGTFKRDHILLLTYAFPWLHLFLGSPFRHSETSRASLFEKLPLSRAMRFRAFALASGVYLALMAGYCFYLLRGLGPTQYFSPDAAMHTEVNAQGDTLTLMTGNIPDYFYGEVPKFKSETRLLAPSLVFEGIVRIPGVLPAAALFYFTILAASMLLHYRRSLYEPGQNKLTQWLAWIPFLLYLGAGLPLLVAPYLTIHATIGAVHAMARSPQAVLNGFYGMIVLNALLLAGLFFSTLRQRRAA